MSNETDNKVNKYQIKVSRFLNACAETMANPEFDIYVLREEYKINKNIISAIQRLGFARWTKIEGVTSWKWLESGFITLDMVNKVITELQSYGNRNDTDKQSKEERQAHDFAPFDFGKIIERLDRIESREIKNERGIESISRRLTRFENNQDKIIDLLKQLAPQAELFQEKDGV